MSSVDVAIRERSTRKFDFRSFFIDFLLASEREQPSQCSTFRMLPVHLVFKQMKITTTATTKIVFSFSGFDVCLQRVVIGMISETSEMRLIRERKSSRHFSVPNPRDEKRTLGRR